MANFNIDYLVIAGGGAGGVIGGGGGAGGFRTSFGTGNINGGLTTVETSQNLTTNTPYTLIVGAGGIATNTPGSSGPGGTSGSGGNSSFAGATTVLCTGGGGGGSYNYGVGGSGGSGGGGSSRGSSIAGGSRVTTPVQGFNGGNNNSSSPYPAGGGGGAARAGVANTSAGPTSGGTALASSITGTPILYAGGGGGGYQSYYSGSINISGGGGGASDGAASDNATNAIANTGSGGGGGGFGTNLYYGKGGNGGSGIVILRYVTADVAGYTTTGSTPTEDTTTIPGQTILSFTTVGTGTITFTPPPPPTPFDGTRVTTPVTNFNKTGTGEGLKIPSGDNSNQPVGALAEQGMIRNDTEETVDNSASAIAHYNGTAWQYFAATESADYPLIPSQNFNTVLYTGNGSSSGQAITGVGFKPDLVWVKRRNAASRHQIQHSLEAGWIDSSDTIPYAPSQAHIDFRPVSTYDSDGFTIPTNYTYNNNASGTYVAWCFKAGGLINKSADFNGSSSYIQTSLSLNAASNSISFWFNADSVGSQNFCLYFNNRGGRIDININGIGSNTPSTSAESILINSTTAIAGWNFVSIVFTGWASSYSAGSYGSAITANVYLNGGAAVSVNPTPYGQSDGLRIGRSGGGYYYDGLIGQVRVFDSALTSSDITALYNETAADNSILNYPQGAGCVAAYPLGENANDLSNTYNGSSSNVTFGKPGYLTRNTEGTIESTVSANVAAGFSVVEVTDHTNTQTIGHGLDSAPELIITKVLDSSSYNWYVYHKDLGNDKYLNLNTTGAANTDNFWNYTFPTSSVFTHRFSSTAFDMIYYCFHSVDGYSKVGSYVGDGGTNNFISTGFEPAFVMIKRTDSTSNWRIFDNKRGTQKELYANSTAAEPSSVSYINFNDLGFTLTSNGGWINNLNGEFIYMALATS
jgi:hypothetical protein